MLDSAECFAIRRDARIVAALLGLALRKYDPCFLERCLFLAFLLQERVSMVVVDPSWHQLTLLET